MGTLGEYARKRNFAISPEPAPSRGARTNRAPFFCVQRHAASHLHYDLRLEVEGTLKSWAVPKGPTLDPSARRLAVAVEDHPLAYSEFEGNIPRGEYGGGSVMLWDRGSYQTAGEEPAARQLAGGEFRFRLAGEKLRGEFALIRRTTRGKRGNEWLLIKKRDAEAVDGWDPEAHARSVLSARTQTEIAAPAAPPDGLKPMLATLAHALPEGSAWAYEVKWDGVRTIASAGAGGVQFVSRGGEDYTRRFPDLSELAEALRGHTAVADGEIVALDEHGVSRFSLLQPQLGGRQPAGGAVRLYLFDLLWLDGEDLRGQTYTERRKRLSTVLRETERVRLSRGLSGAPAKLLEAARAVGLEGLMAKRRESRYQARRSSDWQKVKLPVEGEFVICGTMPGKRAAFSSLVLGEETAEGLRWAGNVGTGFDAAELRRLAAMLTARAAPRPPAGLWPPRMRPVEGGLRCRVRYTERTAQGRLRAPVYLNLLSADEKEERMTVTHPDKIYFPEDGLNKRDLIDYYESMADWILPHLRYRPLSLRRYPNGIHGEAFFQKNLPASTPSWVPSITIYSEESRRDIRYALCPNHETLAYLVNLGCIDHNPWMSRTESLDSPDYLLLDLDPHEAGFDLVIDAARAVRELLAEARMTGLPKTSGGRGIHILVPIAKGQSYEVAREAAAALARLAAARHPDLFTLERSLKKRPGGRIYFDWVQIGRGKTVAAPYSIRPYAGAPVSTPLHWEEVDRGLDPRDFTIKNIAQRLARVGDLLGPLGRGRMSLAAAGRRLRALGGETE